VHALLVFVAGVIAGGVNAVAGGGSLVSFPTLIWLGAPPILANATNATALWPGTLASVWGYRRELRGADRRLYALVVPSAIGSLIGALLLYRTTPVVFDRLVPLLILFATCLLMAQESLQRRFDLSAAHGKRSYWLSWTMVCQLLVAIYGGYFGGGMGILMLATLTLMGQSDIHRMNGLKGVMSAFINGVAAAYFIVAGMVIWADALMMALGAVVGGVGGAAAARYIGRAAVRRIVIVIGLGMALSLTLRL
jgi:uncharacterized membrane protein YfcA